MERIRYYVELKDSRKTRADALSGNSIFEYKARTTNLRELQSAIIVLAQIIAELPGKKGILILDETKISISRLSTEWNSLNKLFQPSILSRLCMIIFSDGSIFKYFGHLSNDELTALPEIRETLKVKYNNKSRRKPDAFFDVLRILIIHWFRRSGPLQLNQLGRLSGFSYPTVAASLGKLESSLIRHSDRSVELKSFPRDDWFKLLAAADKIRTSQGYHARKPRPVESILDRLLEKPKNEIACGGIIGARHYLPGIDLVGTPRLDISVHDWDTGKIDKFIMKLDPGLKRVESGEIPQVVVHSIYRTESLFTKGNRLPIADEVECLLDLHEARLESQALELLEHLIEKTKR